MTAAQPPGLSSTAAAFAVALCCLLPFIAGLVYLHERPWTGSAVGPRLGGYVDPTPHLAFGWWDRSFQKTFDAQLNDRVPLRNWMIRLNNQLDYSLLHTNRLNRGNVRIGRDGNLFEAPYLYETFGYNPRMPDARSHELGTKIRNLQLKLSERGIAFVVLGVPGKPSIVPDSAPFEFKPYRPELPRSYDRFFKIMSELGVVLYDGRAEMRQSPLASRGPFFPVGGTHWTELGAFAAFQRLIDTELRKATGDENARLILDDVTVTRPATGPDADLLELLNLLWPNRDFGSLSIKLHVEGRRFPKPIAIVGTSFVGAPMPVLDKASVAPNVFAITYMRHYYGCATCPGRVLPDDWTQLMLQTSLIVLEVNEQISFGDPTFAPNSFADKFADELTAALDEPRPPN
jgi:hypothetical protein